MTASASALVCVAPGASLAWDAVQAFLTEASLQPASLTFINPVSASTPATSASAAAAGLACVGANREQNREAFAALATALAPGARLYVHSGSEEASSGAQKDLVLSGFNVVKAESSAGIPLVHATKPSWDVGSKSLLKKRPVAPSAATQAPAAAKTWAIDANDADELMDDEELLTEEDKRPVQPIAVPDDCEVGSSGRKACKNCSCGRAEMEQQEAVKLTADMVENPTSACGSCYLGDAFRCATCPYKGLPAFEAGKKIELPKDMLVADI